MATFREEADYDVNLTLRLSMTASFAPMDRERPLRPSDAIGLVLARLEALGVLETLAGEGFAIAYPIDGEATLA